MADYILIKKKTLKRWAAAVVFIIVIAVSWKTVYQYFHHIPHTIVSCSYNVMKADGKALFYFRSIGSDSILNGIAYHNDSVKYGMAPDYTTADLHALVERNLEAITTHLEKLDSIADEIRYYLEVHNVQDEGYDMVVGYQDNINRRIAEAGRLKETLKNASESHRIEIQHIRVYSIADSVAIPLDIHGM